MPDTNPSNDELRDKLTDGAPTGRPEGDLSGREQWWKARHGEGALPTRDFGESTILSFNSDDEFKAFAEALKAEGIETDIFDESSRVLSVNAKEADLPEAIVDLAKQLGAKLSH